MSHIFRGGKNITPNLRRDDDASPGDSKIETEWQTNLENVSTTVISGAYRNIYMFRNIYIYIYTLPDIGWGEISNFMRFRSGLQVGKKWRVCCSTFAPSRFTWHTLKRCKTNVSNVGLDVLGDPCAGVQHSPRSADGWKLKGFHFCVITWIRCENKASEKQIPLHATVTIANFFSRSQNIKVKKKGKKIFSSATNLPKLYLQEPFYHFLRGGREEEER